MNISSIFKIVACATVGLCGGWALTSRNEDPVAHLPASQIAAPPVATTGKVIVDPKVQTASLASLTWDDSVQLCQGYDNVYGGPSLPCGCQGGCDGSCGAVTAIGFGYANPVSGGDPRFTEPPGRMAIGVNQDTQGFRGNEARWRHAGNVPFESFAYGGYIGPHRTPHVPEYRLRVNDQLDFVYLRTRERSLEPYQLFVGDTIRISSAIDATLNQEDLVIRPDGMISLSLIGQVRASGKTVEDLQRELNAKYEKYVKNPSIVVQVTLGETPLLDIIASVDARAGQGGQARSVTVTPDGTVQLPGIGSVPAIGLSLAEIAREVNARYRLRQGGIEVTPIVTQFAPRRAFVLGEVNRQGVIALDGPTTALQAIAQAEGFTTGGNIRQIVVFRRDQNWRLTATKLDLAGALFGKRPHPADEIWLQDSDIILIPKKPIQRFSEAVNLYLTNTLYSIFPQQGVAFNFDDFTSL